MLVATWNVNGLRARLDFVLHWLRARRPDVVGLQELKLTDEQFPHAELEEEGYHAVVHGQKAWNGVAVLARDELVAETEGLPGQEASGARLIAARVGELAFTTAYVPNGKTVEHADFARKLKWLDTLDGYLATRPLEDRAAILCGDFNLCPAPIDSWNEETLGGSIFHTVEERERFQSLLARGFHDIFREKHADRQAFSWWDYRGGAFHQGRGLRIDFLLGTEIVMRRVRSVEIDRDYRKKKEGLTPSDHAPVLAELDWTSRPSPPRP
jgi:exodeoxyribonuclease-3